jgi:hypothetical protein
MLIEAVVTKVCLMGRGDGAGWTRLAVAGRG